MVFIYNLSDKINRYTTTPISPCAGSLQFVNNDIVNKKQKQL